MLSSILLTWGAEQELAYHCPNFSPCSFCVLEHAALVPWTDAACQCLLCRNYWVRWRLLPLRSKSLISPQVREVQSICSMQTQPEKHSCHQHCLIPCPHPNALWAQLPASALSFFSIPNQGLAHPVSAVRKDKISWEPCLAAGRSHVWLCEIMTCSAQRCCCVFIAALLQLGIPDVCFPH